jgi:hypothetical protein
MKMPNDKAGIRQFLLFFSQFTFLVRFSNSECFRGQQSTSRVAQFVDPNVLLGQDEDSILAPLLAA